MMKKVDMLVSGIFGGGAPSAPAGPIKKRSEEISKLMNMGFKIQRGK